jgi:hypothetical protein
MINDVLPPIDGENRVFSEFDDRTSLFNKQGVHTTLSSTYGVWALFFWAG